MHFSPSSSCSTSGFQGGSKKARVASPLQNSSLPPPSLTSRPSDDLHEDSIVAEDPIAEVKSEPLSNPKDAEVLLSKQLALKAGESSRDGSDFSGGFGGGEMPYSDYQDDPSGFEHGDQPDFSSGFTSFPFVTSEQEQVEIQSETMFMLNSQVRNRRQLILQFITANKGRLSDTYVCLICNKQVIWKLEKETRTQSVL